MSAGRAVVAIGGNALILDGQRGTIAEQYDNAVEMARHIATLVAGGWGPLPWVRTIPQPRSTRVAM